MSTKGRGAMTGTVGMRVRDVMSVPAVCLSPAASLHDAATLLAASEASDVMVADADGHLVGVLSEGDLIRAVLPDLDEVRGAGGTLEDAKVAFEAKGADLANRPITPYLISDPLTVGPDEHLAVVSVILVERQIRRLPVVEDGVLVGTVSRSDVCRGVLGAS